MDRLIGFSQAFVNLPFYWYLCLFASLQNSLTRSFFFSHLHFLYVNQNLFGSSLLISSNFLDNFFYSSFPYLGNFFSSSCFLLFSSPSFYYPLLVLFRLSFLLLFHHLFFSVLHWTFFPLIVPFLPLLFLFSSSFLYPFFLTSFIFSFFLHLFVFFTIPFHFHFPPFLFFHALSSYIYSSSRILIFLFFFLSFLFFFFLFPLTGFSLSCPLLVLFLLRYTMHYYYF